MPNLKAQNSSIAFRHKKTFEGTKACMLHQDSISAKALLLSDPQTMPAKSLSIVSLTFLTPVCLPMFATFCPATFSAYAYRSFWRIP